jgi:hypothetical protein
MGRRGKWVMTVLTTASVATIVLFVTGWGSAAASSVSSVLVTNTASHPVPVQEQGTPHVAQSGAWNVGISGTPSVKSSDTATVIAEGHLVDIGPAQTLRIPGTPPQDVSAYREVTFYWELGAPCSCNDHFSALTNDGTPGGVLFDRWPGADFGSRTFDPAPADLEIDLLNDSLDTAQLDYVLVGRNN